MRQETGHVDGPPVLASSTGGPACSRPARPPPPRPTARSPSRASGRCACRGWLRWPQVELGPRAGRIALAAITVGVLVMVLFSTHGPTILVPRASQIFASWEAGPLYHLIGDVKVGARATNYALSGLILIMLGAYLVALAALRTLSMRMIAACIVAVHLLFLLAPPFQLTDVPNYLGYARLGGLHGLNPYTHVIGQEMHDPIYHFATWTNLHSPYGPLFTALSYPLAFVPIPVAYWIVKVATVALSLALIAIVCALRPAPGARPALRRGAARAQPDLPRLRGGRLPQRLLHAGARDRRGGPAPDPARSQPRAPRSCWPWRSSSARCCCCRSCSRRRGRTAAGCAT